MIKSKDKKNYYNHQLTCEQNSLLGLWFALKLFLRDEEKHCCIKENLITKGMAVFTNGGMTESANIKCDAKKWNCIDFLEINLRPIKIQEKS